MSILLTDKHVERTVILLALLATATNRVERERYSERLERLQREHRELLAIDVNDPRVEAKVQELREAFAVDERIGEYDDLCEGHARRDR